MKYRQGSLGRVFIAKVEHGDNLLDEIKSMARSENIEAAVFFMIGALKGADIVSGPQECTVPPEPIELRFNDGREVLGIGTVFNSGDEPVLHLHGVFGRDNDVLMGCLREGAETYLVMEIIMLEVTGAGAFKGIDSNGLMMLDFKE